MTIRNKVIEFLQSIGHNPLLVQGSGGNVSWKDGDVLWVKASGKWLAHCGDQEIFVPVDLLSLKRSLQAGDYSATPRTIGATLLRPSIETLLHVLMPHRIVVHLHPVEVLSHLICADSEARTRKLLNQITQWAYIEYCKPGAELAKATAHALWENPEANVLILENHGIVLGGQNILEVEALLEGLLRCFTREPRTQDRPSPDPLIAHFVDHSSYNPINDKEINWLVYDDRYFAYLSLAWALYPDHVVFLGPRAECYDSFELWREEAGTSIQKSDVVFIRDCGVWVRKDFSQAKQQQLRCYFDVVSRLDTNDQVRTLSPEQIAILMGWEAEHYRQKAMV
jgi:rhamnose utilization protein RhaD (predicted bifunctional aldolase and dehydrogenase)